MKVQLTMDVLNFKIPHTLQFKDKWGSIPIDSLSEKALSNLCDEFRRSVFVKANKRDPQLLYEDETD